MTDSGDSGACAVSTVGWDDAAMDVSDGDTGATLFAGVGGTTALVCEKTGDALMVDVESGGERGSAAKIVWPAGGTTEPGRCVGSQADVGTDSAGPCEPARCSAAVGVVPRLTASAAVEGRGRGAESGAVVRGGAVVEDNVDPGFLAAG